MAMNTAVATGSGLTPLSGVIQTVFSQEVLLAAQPLLKFDQFAVVKTELNVSPGMTISLLGYDNIPLGGKLTEGVQIATKTLSTNTRQITVYEYGNAISCSEFLLQTSFRDVMADGAVLLGRDYATVVDGEERAVLEATTQVVYAGRPTGGRAALTSTNILDLRAIKDGVEVLSTKNIPKVNGDFYVCFVHPHQSRNLRDDSAWINAAQYGDPARIFNGEIGRIEDVVFIETTDLTVIPKSTGATPNTTIDIYRSIMFGAESFAKAVALPVEMRDNGIVDFGREHALAWYSIMGFGTLRDYTTAVLETA